MATKQSEGISVKMRDGRTVIFGKSQKLKKAHIAGEHGVTVGVQFDFVNGESLQLSLREVPGVTLAQLTGHGASQKCGDECADLDNVEDMVEAVRDMIERLTSGKWTAERVGFAGQSILIAALVEVTRQSVEQVRNVLKTLSAKEKAALKYDATIKPVYDRLEAERSKGVDTGAVLTKFQS